MSNSSSISHFLLLALADTWQLQLLHFCLLLGISLAALLGNGLIISAVACGHHLHTPMFFFLLNLALSDLGSICTTVPKAMHNSLWDTRIISHAGCAAQLFFFVFFIGSELCLLTITCYDRYVSFCKPLHYGTLLGSRASMSSPSLDLALSVLYSVVPPALNPLIYSLRNQEVKVYFGHPYLCSLTYLLIVLVLLISSTLGYMGRPSQAVSLPW
ncbi:olfactory receptor 1J4-like [Ammospiza caudacuta]|uniref:olfactory receptor 1J4-like n=1 Tax=Ammospiza caudacuta TaxID=2857398 RepID=UPI0027397CCF|nr:olfactory receptor 1J4-like [Ammospiza caudacuta]